MKERNFISRMKKPCKRNLTLVNYITPGLYTRLNALIDMGFYKICNPLEDDSNNLPEPLGKTNDGDPTTEDSIQYTLIDLHIEPLPEIRNLKIDQNNWMVKYATKPQSQRICWRTKLYAKGKTVSRNQSLVERTENQLSIALEKFCTWFQSVFNDEHTHVTADYIKQLFSSGFEIHPAAHSLYIEPKQIFSIPHEVAEKYHVPELSTKNQKKKLMNLDDSIVPKIESISSPYIAFGKCLPASLKRSPPVLYDSSMKTNIPDELRTDEYLFKGIEGLRSTKFLIKHFDRPDLQEMKPLYFKNFKYEDDDNHVPLYKRLENKI